MVFSDSDNAHLLDTGMGQSELKTLLGQPIAAWESEVVEFKRAGNDYDTDRIGDYFSTCWRLAERLAEKK
ncbi:hypothetical protein BGV68_05420 [Burkholderia ubonensis]|nr:hypothetical protein BGV68_05420 [Burkholderia ubonensis]